MNLTIKNSGSRKYPYYILSNNDIEFCATVNKNNAMLIKKTLANINSNEINTGENDPEIEKILSRIMECKNVDLKVNFTQDKEIVNLRFIFCKMARDLEFPFHEIGKAINRRHPDVLHACRKFNDYYQTDPEFRELYKEITKL
jgi:chromosomal replication initiation ATPase DnaA